MKKALFGLILAAALLLALSQFLPLFHTYVTAGAPAVGSGTVGSQHDYGVLLIAVLALLLGMGVLASGSRFALLFLALLAIASAVIALGPDLSHARESGLAAQSGHFATAHNIVGVGLYVELAGALVLLGAAVFGFLLAPSTLAPVGRPGAGPRGGTRGPGTAPKPRRRARSEIIERQRGD